MGMTLMNGITNHANLPCLVLAVPCIRPAVHENPFYHYWGNRIILHMRPTMAPFDRRTRNPDTADILALLTHTPPGRIAC